MDKTYTPENIEQKHYQRWESENWFAPDGQGQPYSIMIPPPNVTGSLHMGHAFQHTLMDTLIRYHRMLGDNTLWQPGSDHAGIATQMVVERQLAAQGQSRHEIGRDAFMDRIWEWKAQSGGTISEQMRHLGDSVDWSRERFTMDDGLSNAVREVFVRLYHDGLIYRGKRLVNWDPKLHTAISDLEVENHEENGHLWHFRYPLADGARTANGKDYLVVATTRPETMLGDTCVAVHPDDARYTDLVGQSVLLPLVNRRIPIVADDYVDAEFGSGCVKITPAHDFNDYQVGKRHSAALINIFSQDARVLPQAEVFHYDGTERTDIDATLPDAFAHLDRYDAREMVVQGFTELGLLDQVKEHVMMVPRGDRSGVAVEPWLTDQWYVDAKKMAGPAIKAVADGHIRFVPRQWENTYFAWMRDIQDWCISRQLWWGHRIPAWYDAQGTIYVGRTEDEVRQANNLGADSVLHQDEDVLDTWFSSALWTFSTLGWPEDTPELRTFHPSSVLVTGFDIIFFWVARMIMMSSHFMRNEDGSPQVPFHEVYVTGLIRDENGQKMSKSKGNVIDPLDLINGISADDLVAKRTQGLMQPKLAARIEKATRKSFPQGFERSGTDALRFTLNALASTGRDVRFDVKRLEGYRNFCNKLWNAARYVQMNTRADDGAALDCGQWTPDPTMELSLADRWIRSRLQRLETDLNRHFTHYRFDMASQALYDFVWHEYCDWYLELSKPVFWDESARPEQLRGTRFTLIQVLETVLRLAHPIMPFITEEIWLSLRDLSGRTGETVMLQPYPQADETQLDAEAEADITWVQGVIVSIRNIRGEMGIAPGQSIPVLLGNGSSEDRRRLADNLGFLQKLARLESIDWIDDVDQAPPAATQLVGDMQVLVPMAGLIDVTAEKSRLDKAIEKAEKELARVNGKLGNSRFTANAPAQVVTKERAKAAAAESSLAQLQTQRAKLDRL